MPKSIRRSESGLLKLEETAKDIIRQLCQDKLKHLKIETILSSIENETIRSKCKKTAEDMQVDDKES